MLWTQKNLGSEKFSPQKIFCAKKLFVLKNWVLKKKGGAEKNLGP